MSLFCSLDDAHETPYALVDVAVDVTRPLERVALDASADGMGLLLRDGRRPLAFVLVPRPDRHVAPPELDRLAVEVGAQVC